MRSCSSPILQINFACRYCLIIQPIIPKYFGVGVKLTDFAVVFKLGVRRVSWSGGFVVLAGVFVKISGDLDPFGCVQDTGVEPHLSRFRCAGRHAGLGGGLRARIASRICPKMLRASWRSAKSGLKFDPKRVSLVGGEPIDYAF